MGRPGLPLIVLLTLLASYVAFAVALAVWPSGETSYGSGPKLHPPSSAGERAAASAGIVYLQALQRRDVVAACRVADAGLGRRLGCDGARRASRVRCASRPDG